MREINLAGNPLGPMGALVVAIALKGGSLAQLEALDMSTCELGMAGLKHLLGGLKSHGASRALQTLRLGGNGFGEEGLVELAALLAMPGCLRRLRVLDLSHSNLQDATLPRAFSRKGLRVVLE
jgi:Ran GTPase-activating protein (RanGAP) involved in mRNA processing and transport